MKNKYYGLISTIPDRFCGIASFAKDIDRYVLSDVYDYGFYSIEKGETPHNTKMRSKIRYTISQEDEKSWENLGDFIIEEVKQRRNEGIRSGYILNHEFGIFGPDHNTDMASGLLKKLHDGNIPTITILHTILREPNPPKKEAIIKIGEYTSKIICLSSSGVRTLAKRKEDGGVYEVSRHKLINIPHGVPEMDIEESREELKNKFGLKPKTDVFSSLGFFSESKGLEYSIGGWIKALKNFESRDATYLILGSTHPEVHKSEGHQYFDSLIRLAKEGGLKGGIIHDQNNYSDLEGNKISNLKGREIIFKNKYLEDKELLRMMKMSDAGIIGNTGRDQISSGPGAYWIGSSRITIATKSPFFMDLEEEGIGLLVDFESEEDFADRMSHVLHLEVNKRHELELSALNKSSTIGWSLCGEQMKRLMDGIIDHPSNKQ